MLLTDTAIRNAKPAQTAKKLWDRGGALSVGCHRRGQMVAAEIQI